MTSPISPLFAEGLELADDIRADIETAAEFGAAAAELYEITEQAAQLARQELAEARAKVDQADDAHARSARAVDVANRELVAKLRAAGLVRTADGITTPGAAAVAESNRRAAEEFDQARALARDGIDPL